MSLSLSSSSLKSDTGVYVGYGVFTVELHHVDVLVAPAAQDPFLELLPLYIQGYGVGERDSAFIAKTIKEVSDEFSTDPVLVAAIVAQESGFRKDSVSSHGAVGLMQIIPSTAAMYGVGREELFDTKINILTGVSYLVYLINYFNGDERMAIIAYNQGIGNVNKGTYKTWYYEKIRKKYSEINEFIYTYQK